MSEYPTLSEVLPPMRSRNLLTVARLSKNNPDDRVCVRLPTVSEPSPYDTNQPYLEVLGKDTAFYKDNDTQLAIRRKTDFTDVTEGLGIPLCGDRASP